MEGSSSSGSPLMFVLAFFGGLFILWVVTGGPDRTPSSGLFGPSSRSQVSDVSSLGPDASRRQDIEQTIYDTREQLERLQKDLEQVRIKGEASPYEGLVGLSGGRARDRYAQTEYLELRASSGNTIDVPITGWTVESVVTGERATIGTGTSLPFPGVSNTLATIFLSPGERAYVVTGRSPIGVNFKVNQCTGYLDQYQTFSPSLPNACPDPTDEFDELAPLPVTNVRLERDDRETCRTYIDRYINRCELHTKNLNEVLPRLTSACKDFIEETYTYRGCVDNHRYDKGFYKDEWRIYLGSPAELWRERREIIRLLDQNGKTVDILDY